MFIGTISLKFHNIRIANDNFWHSHNSWWEPCLNGVKVDWEDTWIEFIKDHTFIITCVLIFSLDDLYMSFFELLNINKRSRNL